MESSPFEAAEPLAFDAAPLPAVAGARGSELELRGDDAGPSEEVDGTWDWGNLIDFAIEEDVSLISPWEEEEERPVPAPLLSASLISQLPPQESSPGSSIQGSATGTASKDSAGAGGRVRKRDPRLLCDNFNAGRIPCSCPELDEKEEEEPAGTVSGGSRKKVRAGGAAAIARCQVPGCGADIRELKGYHRRHRVCLKCANASSVFLDGESKRYCQQCGKFHILPDFDEGKRSCRRKLERHNKRRRRKPGDPKDLVENEKDSPSNPSIDASCDEETKANTELSNGIVSAVDSVPASTKVLETRTSLEPEDDEQGSPGLSVPSFRTVQGNSISSAAPSCDTQLEERVENTKSTISSPFCGNKGTYSSMCPTGRVSFKLYDWNPAEFPRRLRHQIFQWLSSMPVELEGYIRPGCTILTLFIVMPQFMWDKLSKDSASYVNDLVKGPQSLLSERGNMLIYLNNKIFQVLKDGTLLENIKMEVQVPKLHFVYPNCFESGRPVEFVVCGSNLLHHKFRFLVSCAGGYLQSEFCGVVSHGMVKCCHEIGDDINGHEHQMLLIRIHNTNPDMFGPAFVEVENECGISNFLPVLFGNKSICSEMMKLQGFSIDSLSGAIVSEARDKQSISCQCNRYASIHSSTSDLLLDIAWCLREPASTKDEILSSFIYFRRLNCLMKHLLQSDSFSTLERVLHHLDIFTEGKGLGEFTSRDCDPEIEVLLTCVREARNILHERKQLNRKSDLDSQDFNAIRIFRKNDDLKDRASFANEGDRKVKFSRASKIEEKVSLLDKGTDHGSGWNSHHPCRRQQDSWFNVFSGKLTLLVVVSVVMCCGMCVALLHPHKTGYFVATMRRCLFGSGNHR